MADLLDFGGVRVFTSNAAPGAGYTAYFYESGTTTPVTVYTESTLSTAHGTSIEADAEGWFAEAWTPGGIAIKCVITDEDGATYRTIDPVISVSSTTSGASDIPFTPTVALPFTDVQAAVEGAAASAATGFTPYGLGVTGTNATIANIDATGTASGAYRFTAGSTGTFPTGVAATDTGIVEIWREDSGSARMWLYPDNSDRSFIRRMASSTWGAWREEIHSNQAPADGDILYRASGAWTRLAKGAAYQDIRMNAGATAPEWSGFWDYTSAAQVIAANTTVTVTHSLGARPSHCMVKLVCTSADANYPVGAEIFMATQVGGGIGLTIWTPNTTQISIRPATVITVNDTAGTVANIDMTKWQAVILANR